MGIVKNRNGVKIMKKLVFKKWLNDILVCLCAFSILLILMSVDSYWNIEYFKFVLSNVLIASISSFLLYKWGRKFDDEEEEFEDYE